MTELTRTRRPSTEHSSTRPAPTAEPTLITEEQVRFGTAAARFPSPTHRHWPSALDAVRGLWHHSGRQPARNHYPQRFAYLDEALLSRECVRL
ncbi:Uncharacterised protein [Mycolicibacterium flavescens]|uniref:hypothetical protein n=1 Tax=Mycobacterium neumannii TaxID=2048551 RepID=UPI000B93E467|nr:hypothetical protein [Mycobacterium neumannii]VEG40830.1 Uncharacterised protein [Mycolicibacterium flavescens]